MKRKMITLGALGIMAMSTCTPIAFANTDTTINYSTISAISNSAYSPLGTILGNELYKVAFDREFTVSEGLFPEFGEGTPYEKETKENTKWYQNIPKETLKESFIDIDGSEKNLNAYYLENPVKTDKTVIVAHGYRGSSLTMGAWAKIYYDLGYNILTPDARGHGESEGRWISFGWKEKEDYKNWINKMIEMNGSDSEVILHGVSMGAATVMMTSGEDLPKNVSHIIEDCGYTSLSGEIDFLKKDVIPKGLEQLGFGQLIPYLDEGIKVADTKLIKNQGFNMNEASALDQIKKSQTPILFIHGEEDNFVPTYMVNELYDSIKQNPEMKLYNVAKAKHAESIMYELPEYKQRVKEFLAN